MAHAVHSHLSVSKLLLVTGIVVLAGLAFVGAFSARPQAAEPQTSAAAGSAQRAAGDQTIEISEADLTTTLSQQLVGRTLGTTPMGPATLQRITAQLRSGQLYADGDALVGSATVPVAMTAAMHADSGRALVVVEDLRAAGVPLPASTRAPVQQAIQSQVDAQVQRLKLRVTSLAITEGKLRLTGSPQE